MADYQFTEGQAYVTLKGDYAIKLDEEHAYLTKVKSCLDGLKQEQVLQISPGCVDFLLLDKRVGAVFLELKDFGDYLQDFDGLLQNQNGKAQTFKRKIAEKYIGSSITLQLLAASQQSLGTSLGTSLAAGIKYHYHIRLPKALTETQKRIKLHQLETVLFHAKITTKMKLLADFRVTAHDLVPPPSYLEITYP